LTRLAIRRQRGHSLRRRAVDRARARRVRHQQRHPERKKNIKKKKIKKKKKKKKEKRPIFFVLLRIRVSEQLRQTRDLMELVAMVMMSMQPLLRLVLQLRQPWIESPPPHLRPLRLKSFVESEMEMLNHIFFFLLNESILSFICSFVHQSLVLQNFKKFARFVKSSIVTLHTRLWPSPRT
jgi:hypothetical protein